VLYCRVEKVKNHLAEILTEILFVFFVSIVVFCTYYFFVLR